MADLTAHSMASAFIMHRSSWFQSLGLPHEGQQTLQDLPFVGMALFSEQTDSKLQSLKDSRETLKSLGLHTPAPVRKHYMLQLAAHFFHHPARQDYGRRKSRGYRRKPQMQSSSASTSVLAPPPDTQWGQSRHFDGTLRRTHHTSTWIQFPHFL